ncbi:hypothetical protein DAPPUDRAFT_304391 [Daphnia pulex]|uniref:Uncharacterized protein n=1 Tax=Daphnia pulex TaxID=6669 RepID=E9HU81_DAPPU|nr:hypothetical protein DAPPUDRAFT_304391 [Daphnia pulex]|eukprot:EFX64699.1 hypothetical protein DAPPUDRAFT_304391 [Daphnia pulex]
MEGREKGHGKKAAAYVLYKSANIGCTLCAAAMGRQQHSKLSPPNKPANKVQHFLFFSSVCSRIVRLFSCCAARIKCHDEFLN